ncbi:MAG: prolipoprotein diacylglyceryl transferase [Victivallales bacterium]|nr:prolipoprotein diacylglyceryl transferase [Victivallales bacterium]
MFDTLCAIDWSPDPELFNVFGISIRYYGLLFMGGIVFSTLVMGWMFKREGIPGENLERLSVYGIIGILVGARLGHCLLYEPGYYLSRPLELFLPIYPKPGGGYAFIGYQGLASHGGAAGLIIALYLYCRKTKESMLRLLDLIGVAAPLAGSFIRLANLMNSEIIGKPTEVPWGFVFKRVDGLSRHPAQLYESLAYLAIFAVMLVLYVKFRERYSGSGVFLGISLALIFTARFLIEFVKEHQANFESSLPLDMGQLLSIPFVVAGVVLIVLGAGRVRGGGKTG